MASRAQTLPAMARPNGLDEPAAWFWQFLKAEMAPYPGRAWKAARITVAATIAMLLVMTFRVPYGFLAALYTILISRESPIVTFRMGIKIVLSFAIAVAYCIVSIMILVDDPLTHFLWIAISLLLAFYLIHAIPEYLVALAFSVSLTVIIALWDQTLLPVNDRLEDTLWAGYSVLIGAVVTVVVEFAFHALHPGSDLTQALESRLSTVEDILRQIVAEQPLSEKLEKQISLYAALGTSNARRELLRSGRPPQLIARMNIASSLLGRLIDLTASMRIVRGNRPIALSPADRDRCLRLADQIAQLRLDVQQGRLPRAIDVPSEVQASDLPLLHEMERTVALIPSALSGTENLKEPLLQPPLDAEAPHRLLVPDAFTNPEHLKFAIRGAGSAMLAYVSYQAINWPGLNTAMLTCMITAVSTIGSSRQKQLLRLAGTILGGIVMGIGAQVFVLPYIDSIVGFTVLFAVVTGISAWIVTATPRLSFLGIQVALAFYLINLQEFTIESSLVPARDRLVGVLLGLLSMRLVFDRLWVRDALQEMQEQFARNLRLLAELIDQSRKDDRLEAVRRIIQLRDQIDNGFNVVRAQADAVLFEFGPSRERKLAIRDDIRRWQPTLGALLQVQITFLQYLLEQQSMQLPPAFAEAETAFGQDLATIARAMSDEVEGKTPAVAPDIQSAARRLQGEIEQNCTASGVEIPPRLVDMITLTQSLAFIVAPLYADIHATFTSPQQAAINHPQVVAPNAANV